MSPEWSKTLTRITDHVAAALFKNTVLFPFFHFPYLSFCSPPVTVLNGRVQEPGPRHRGLGQALEEAGGVGVPGKRDIPSGVEEQKFASETVHDEGPETRPHDVRRQVRSRGQSSDSVR